MEQEIKLLKGNEAVAEAAVRCGCDGYFGYPITPQSEILETLMELRPWETTGMVVLQAESEVAAINMIYGGASTGKRVLTSSSSPGISLMGEGLSYMAGAELPCVVVNVSRGGPGLGTIQPGQSDYFLATRAGGHGDFNMIVLAPNSVQEMYDFIFTAFDLAFRYRNPVMILSDGVIGQMMEKVTLSPALPRRTQQEIARDLRSWALTGKPAGERRNIVTSVQLDPHVQEGVNHRLQAKYKAMRENEVRCESFLCEDADYVIVAYGCSARISRKAVELAREAGLRVGLFRPITLFPFPYAELSALNARGFLSVELSAGQMVEDVRLSVGCRARVEHFGRMGGVIHSPNEVFEALTSKFTDK
ncbi:MAG: 3-methyl-2-oxobutanoate dehydrogenase subunit VorB [Rikenellaceae bacterium]|jgi:2-oxoglutarate ferredoxin oxidoreductase subunit alpha|nr:3-methyl-2-oxobutanoate dehydrogenase subunit VorB [Rikenellaceae bacterium]